jgi:hypothetical protein
MVVQKSGRRLLFVLVINNDDCKALALLFVTTDLLNLVNNSIGLSQPSIRILWPPCPATSIILVH